MTWHLEFGSCAEPCARLGSCHERGVATFSKTPPPEPARDESGAIIYPETWSTEHYECLTFLKDGLETFFSDRADVFVAGNMLWYPVEGRPDINAAQDVMVAIGRPKGRRGSYKQWEERNVAPQVVFEALSQVNTAPEMMRKLNFYMRYGVQEYFVYDPRDGEFQVWTRQDGSLKLMDDVEGYRSQLMGLRFWVSKEDHHLRVELPDGSPMLSNAGQVKRAETEKPRADVEKRRADQLAEKLRSLGLDPNAL